MNNKANSYRKTFVGGYNNLLFNQYNITFITGFLTKIDMSACRNQKLMFCYFFKYFRKLKTKKVKLDNCIKNVLLNTLTKTSNTCQ